MLQHFEKCKIKNYDAATSSSPFHLVEVEDDISASFELLKLLHNTSQQPGWTLLLAPDAVPTKTVLNSCAIDPSKLLVIRQRHLCNIKHVVKSALLNGNFSALIAWQGILSNPQLEALEQYVETSQAQFYCFTQANNNSSETEQLC